MPPTILNYTDRSSQYRYRSYKLSKVIFSAEGSSDFDLRAGTLYLPFG